MSYTKMMKWNKNNPKGISYKRGYMGFNPSGITSEEIIEREKNFVNDMKSKTYNERLDYFNNMKEMQKVWKHSYPWEWCAFERNFCFNNKLIY